MSSDPTQPRGLLRAVEDPEPASGWRNEQLEDVVDGDDSDRILLVVEHGDEIAAAMALAEETKAN